MGKSVAIGVVLGFFVALVKILVIYVRAFCF